MKVNWWKYVLILMLLAGCTQAATAPAQAPSAEAEPSAEPVTPTSTREVATQPGNRPGGPGISYEENLRINPPAAQNLAAEATGEGILLTWEAPPEVTVPHSYSDEIFGYKIYRRAEDEPLTGRALLAETQELRYLDTSAAPGVMYYYTVTALHGHNVESTRPDEVGARR